MTITPILKELVEFLNKNDKASRRLWWILTALRGPDDDNDSFKRATTAVIRHSIGLNAYIGNCATVLPDTLENVNVRTNSKNTGDGHFRLHVQEAFKALDLQWGGYNGR